MELHALIQTQKEKVKNLLDKKELALGEILFNTGECQILSQSPDTFELIVNTPNGNGSTEYKLRTDGEDNIIPIANNEQPGWDKYSYACLLQIENELNFFIPKDNLEHKEYTREGMIQRVLQERRQKADTADYRIAWANNIYGDHLLVNEKGVKYKIFLRDFEKETGYSNSADAAINKLGTTKHIMYAFNKLKENRPLFQRLSKTFPFVEIYCDPLNDYKITWYYPHELPIVEQLLISRYFKNSSYIENDDIFSFLSFITEADDHKLIRVRPEVPKKIEAAFERSMLQNLAQTITPDFNVITTELFEYQKEGIRFSLFKKASIIADDMGLGKTVQAIGAAILKKQIFDFKKTLIVCPASIKEQWKKEIERFSPEKACIVEGFPDEREEQYINSECYFLIVNYETVLRDSLAINKAGIDFLILDEAQRVKNYETKTATSIKKLEPKHILVITGTPIENRLIDIFSIVSILDPWFFGPLWEFSYQHCLFDPDKHNKINGYHNLQKLNKKLEEILIRREKRTVLDQLPNLQQINIPFNFSPLQAEYHAGYASGIAQIIHKKFLTPFDLQRLQILLANMRMVCDSTYLIDEETNESPKLEELKYMLLEKMDIANTHQKIIIFSEWIKVHKLIGRMLRENNIGFVELNGKIPVKSRGELIHKFETNDNYKIFLSTEAGGSGLNLQVADTIINFELPWNPAKKNQRIGRIDRLGQKSNKLTIYNFITRKSIEEQIATGLLVKQSLFDGVLDSSNTTDFVDFSSKGRSQFIEQLEQFINSTITSAAVNEITEESITQLIEEQNISEEIAASENLDLSGDANEPQSDRENTPDSQPHDTQTEKVKEIEQVMNNGMQFLSGLFKMSTGKDMGIENQKIEINRETGEVTMKFKLPF